MSITRRGGRSKVTPLLLALAGWMCLAGAVGTGAQDPSTGETTARGVVYEDANRNGRRDAGEAGLAGVRVSNGRDVVTTDEQGRYSVGVDDDDAVFVIKPRGYMTPLDEHNLPRFYYIHKPAGSPEGLKYRGVEPTGPLPESIDFGLHKQEEPERFRAVFFGDTQPRNVQEVEYLGHDVVEELIGFEAAFGVTLGDIVFDDLSVFEPYIQTVALIGLPWYNVLGNHDINFDATSDEHSDETFERYFGPATYSFDYGPVHYVVLDNVRYSGDPKSKKYAGGLSREQMQFIVNDLKHVPTDRLVVFMMHIPLYEVPERRELFEVIRKYPHTLSISAHTHYLEHVFMGPSHGNNAPQPHHHYVAVTTCGSWWTGVPDERGIPHTTMRDGAPNGYTIISFDGNGYSMRFKAARRPADEQMSIYAPNEVPAGALADTEVIVNVYAGSERSVVEMRVGDRPWTKLAQELRPDPYFADLKAMEERAKAAGKLPGRALPKIIPSPHIWVGRLPGELSPGTHLIEVRTKDMFGQEYTGRRIIRVSGAAE